MKIGNEIKCDCGSETFFKFGTYPIPGDKDDGLRLIYTCMKCGDQLGVYQRSKMLHKKRHDRRFTNMFCVFKT